MGRVDAAPSNVKLDLARAFHITVTPPPAISRGERVDFRKPEAIDFEAGVGWLPPKSWGSYTIGPTAALDVRLPTRLCRTGSALRLQVDPYLPPSRPSLSVKVAINGRLVTTWHFHAGMSPPVSNQASNDNHAKLWVEAPVPAGLPNCLARIRLTSVRGPVGRPAPDEDSRPLQLRVMALRVAAVAK